MVLELCILSAQNKTHHSSVPFFSDMMISPLISLLNGQHFQNAFIVDIKPRHLHTECLHVKQCHVHLYCVKGGTPFRDCFVTNLKGRVKNDNNNNN
jgi:hypothetical protein